MIKINLAKKKQIAYAGSDQKAAPINSSDMKELMGRVMVPLVLIVGMYFGWEYYVEQRKAEMQVEIANTQKEKTKIENELAKFSGFEKQKAELEKTANAINIKITTIEKLIRGKDATLKALIDLAQALPKEVWLTDFVATSETYNINGSTYDIGLVSDLMVKLGTSIYFKNITLKSSQTEPNGKVANFELSARRQ